MGLCPCRSGGSWSVGEVHGARTLTLREKQSAFALLVAKLIQHADCLGYTITLGEVYRSPEEAARLAKAGKGIVSSLHTQRLAIDLNLFKDGFYQTASEAYGPLGEWWEGQSTTELMCHWGGRFSDGNHFSVGHGGRK
jgi:hypothetical protein